MIARALSVCVFAVLALVVVPGVAAQPSRFEVSGGYQVTRAAEQTFAIGWSAGVATNLNDAWSVIAEINRARRVEPDAELDVDVTLSILTSGAGMRWSRRGGGVVPFVQLLAGATMLSADAEVHGTGIGESVTKFMLQPGGGADVRLNDRFGLVGQADYRRVFLDDSDGESGENQFRVFLGVRVGL